MGIESLSLEKVNAVVGMLASDQDGEVLAAARLLCRMAKKSNLKINEFLKPLATAPAPDARSDHKMWGTHQASEHHPGFTSDMFQQFSDFIMREGQRNTRTQRPTHKSATMEIVRRINAKCAGTTILTVEDLALLHHCTTGIHITAAQAQALAILARRVGV